MSSPNGLIGDPKQQFKKAKPGKFLAFILYGAVTFTKLQELENFDPSVFNRSADASQKLCDFVLSAALFYNDLKDIVEGHILLQRTKPTGVYAKTKEWGAFCGIDNHLMRQAISIVQAQEYWKDFLRRKDETLG